MGSGSSSDIDVMSSSIAMPCLQMNVYDTAMHQAAALLTCLS